MHPRPRRLRNVVALIALTVVVSATTTAVADHLFPDVPDAGFHDQIANVATAGCAAGFNDGTFRPQDPTTRGQFAAWMNRCGGRTTAEVVDIELLDASGPDNAVILGDAAITAGATGPLSTHGFVTITGSVVARTPAPANCPCFVQIGIWDLDTDLEVGSQVYSAIPAGATDLGEGFTAVPVQAVARIEPDSTRRFGIRAFFVDANVGSVQFEARLSAQYFPFGPTGTDELQIIN